MQTPSRKTSQIQDPSWQGLHGLSLEKKLNLMDAILSSLKKDTSEEASDFYINENVCPNEYIDSAGSQDSISPQEPKSSEAKKKVNLKPRNGERYPKEIKEEAVKIACKTNNNHEALRQVKEKYREENLYQNLSEKTIRQWRSDPEFNQELEFDRSHHTQRQIRKIISPYNEQERVLIETIKERRLKHGRVTKDWIVSEAIKTFNDPHFQGSNGWFDRFKRRWRLSRRVATHVVQKLSLNYMERIILWIIYVLKSLEKRLHGFNHSPKS